MEICSSISTTTADAMHSSSNSSRSWFRRYLLPASFLTLTFVADAIPYFAIRRSLHRDALAQRTKIL
ncbi:hypothetical protein T11_2435 [Trichinella zimbabwensis]|uniref:Uncharacterized protein n=1 Tax=Trichinella zimbabwensis TaxID=268475 RepID=A0A0V1HDE1_9BILA|nr:hypothetical protein T11_2435 [Trichinella zimbabwensis]